MKLSNRLLLIVLIAFCALFLGACNEMDESVDPLLTEARQIVNSLDSFAVDMSIVIDEGNGPTTNTIRIITKSNPFCTVFMNAEETPADQDQEQTPVEDAVDALDNTADTEGDADSEATDDAQTATEEESVTYSPYIYVLEDDLDGNIYAYQMIAESMWMRRTLEELRPIEFDVRKDIAYFVNAMQDVEQVGSEIVDGKTAVQFEGTIKSVDLEEFFYASTALNVVSIPAEERSNFNNVFKQAGDVTVTLWVDEKTAKPMYCEIDTTPLIEALFAQILEDAGMANTGQQLSQILLTFDCYLDDQETRIDLPPELAYAMDYEEYEYQMFLSYLSYYINMDASQLQAMSYDDILLHIATNYQVSMKELRKMSYDEILTLLTPAEAGTESESLPY